jgi:hypothetical protein
MREARAEKDDSHDKRRNQRQSRHGSGTGRARRAGEGCLEEGCQQEGRKSVTDGTIWDFRGARQAVDEIEDARSPCFHKAQQLSTRWTYLIETKHVENGTFSKRLETALETVDRFCVCSFFSGTYRSDHLSKQQVVASDGGTKHWL